MNFALEKVYSFELKAPAILGARASNLRYQGAVAFTIASRIDNVVLKHTQVLPQLPSGTVQDARNLTFHTFLAENGNLVVYAEPWILEESIEQIGNKDVQFLIEVEDLASINQITTLLATAGFPVKSYSVL
jgi:hypothetical protein